MPYPHMYTMNWEAAMKTECTECPESQYSGLKKHYFKRLNVLHEGFDLIQVWRCIQCNKYFIETVAVIQPDETKSTKLSDEKKEGD